MIDGEYWTYLDGKLVTVPPIADLCASLYKKFNDINNENERLKEENKKHRENTWKEEEVERLKSENERLHKDLIRGFDITETEEKVIKKIIKENSITDFYYEFRPFAIGVAGYIVNSKDNSKHQFRYE